MLHVVDRLIKNRIIAWYGTPCFLLDLSNRIMFIATICSLSPEGTIKRQLNLIMG